MRYENNEDLKRELKAIKKFVGLFKGSYKKLGPNDIDFRIFDSNNKICAYAEVKGKSCLLKDSFPLYVAARKLVKLCDKRLNPIIMWACEDGIIYAKVPELVGEMRWGGRTEVRDEAVNDKELMVYFEDPKPFKYVKF
ncbi:MAG: hypothetical protein Unbinned1524contig1000_59 [Prokaryotic dsDNA virus sp.]|nr:MAG: hypothetical protein Unbinned1524contig1000_59 [Prokaryotic dsDNA virus sp.]|tara:strand:+ start:12044 stop:12457 length:414 start_codon:yes stop_codon:yes gene_type:complete